MTTMTSTTLQLEDTLFLTDGGLETTLIFHDGIDLPLFACFVLVDTDEGRDLLRRYYRRYAATARELGTGLILESPTWRASSDWGPQLGYSEEALAAVNRRSVELLRSLAAEVERDGTEVLVSGCIGPRGDGYTIDERPTVESAELYHRPQIRTLAAAGADMVSAFTLTCPEEAIGICRAATAEGIPVVISFTVETDGRLPSGESLKQAIQTVDEATKGAVAYFMINCAHPTHFLDSLDPAEPWTKRIRGVRANASTCSHEELDEATELDDGNPGELAARYLELDSVLPELVVFGGCCGTDHRHVEAICSQVIGARVRSLGTALSNI
jgi:S-methylmethionine-dependent homocysteine/selenocysteine methylase